MHDSFRLPGPRPLYPRLLQGTMSPPGGFQPRPESGYTGTSSPVLSGPALYGPEELMFIRM